MTIEYKKIIVDGHHLAFRNFFGQRDLSYQGRGTGLPYGFIASLLTIREEFGDGKFYIVWDKGHKLRDEIYPEYKANRGGSIDEDTYAEFYKQKAVLKRLLRNLGVVQVYKEGAEGDDVCASLVNSFKNEQKLVVTNDHDLFQLINKKTRVLRSVKGGSYRVYSEKGFKKDFDFWPIDYRYVLALTGDKGDNIPGVPSIGLKRATEIFNDNPARLPELLEHGMDHELEGKPAAVKAVMNNLKTARLALKLVTLYNIERLTFVRGKLNERVVRSIFSRLGFIEFRKKDKWKIVKTLGR